MIRGLWTALPPLYGSTDSVLGHALEYLLHNGVDGFFVMGTTGQGADRSLGERQQFLERLVGLTGVPKQMVVAISANPARDVRDLMAHAFSLGVQGVAMTPPFYGAWSQAELAEWLHGVFDGMHKEGGVYLYNMPAIGHTVWSTDNLSLVDEIVGGIDGIKDSSGDVNQLLQYVAWAKGHGASVMVGNEGLTTFHYLSGGHGVVSGLSAVYPRVMADLIQYCFYRQWDQAVILQRDVNRLLQGLTRNSLRAGSRALVDAMQAEGILGSW